MEIPTIKIELYLSDPELFSQQLGQALENIGAAQVDGLKQQLVDKLYENSEQAFAKYGSLWHHYPEYSPLQSQKLCRQIMRLDSATKCNLEFDSVVTEVTQNLEEIYQKVILGMKTYKQNFTPINGKHLMIMVRYSPEEETILSSEKAPKEIIVKEEHYDARRITLAPRATALGLEGYIHNEWVPLIPDYGNTLVFTGLGSANPLKHRITAPFPFAKTRKALVYGGN